MPVAWGRARGGRRRGVRDLVPPAGGPGRARRALGGRSSSRTGTSSPSAPTTSARPARPRRCSTSRSLSVEEQFYAAWPVVPAAPAPRAAAASRRPRGAARHRDRAQRVLLAAGDGARSDERLLRHARSRLGAARRRARRGDRTARARLPGGLRTGIGAFGMVVIVLGGVWGSNALPVPFPSVAFGVVGAALVVWADAPARYAVLGDPVSQWLGRVSYSLYLWHFPVIVFAASLFGDSLWVALACLPVMLGLSELSVSLRRAGGARQPVPPVASRSTNPRRFVVRDLVVGGLVLVLLGGLTVVQLRGLDELQFGDDLTAALGEPHLTPAPAAAATGSDSEREAAVEGGGRGDGMAGRGAVWARCARRLAVRPGEDRVPERRADLGEAADLLRDVRAPPGTASPHELVVVGDSVAISWVPAFRGDREGARVGLRGDRLRELLAHRRRLDQHRRRPRIRRRVREAARADVRVDHCAASGRRRHRGGAVGDRVPRSEPRRADRGVAGGGGPDARRLSAVPQVVFHLGRRHDGVADRLRESPERPAACVTPMTERDLRKIAAEQAAAAIHPNTTYIDATTWFCTDECRSSSAIRSREPTASTSPRRRRSRSSRSSGRASAAERGADPLRRAPAAARPRSRARPPRPRPAGSHPIRPDGDADGGAHEDRVREEHRGDAERAREPAQRDRDDDLREPVRGHPAGRAPGRGRHAG